MVEVVPDLGTDPGYAWLGLVVDTPGLTKDRHPLRRANGTEKRDKLGRTKFDFATTYVRLAWAYARPDFDDLKSKNPNLTQQVGPLWPFRKGPRADRVLSGCCGCGRQLVRAGGAVAGAQRAGPDRPRRASQAGKDRKGTSQVRPDPRLRLSTALNQPSLELTQLTLAGSSSSTTGTPLPPTSASSARASTLSRSRPTRPRPSTTSHRPPTSLATPLA